MGGSDAREFAIPKQLSWWDRDASLDLSEKTPRMSMLGGQGTVPGTREIMTLVSRLSVELNAAVPGATTPISRSDRQSSRTSSSAKCSGRSAPKSSRIRRTRSASGDRRSIRLVGTDCRR